MIFVVLLFLISQTFASSGSETGNGGNLAFRVPEYSLNGEISFGSIVFATTILLTVFFINFPSKRFMPLQEKSTIFLGMYFGVPHIIYSFTPIPRINLWMPSISFWISIASSIIAVVLSFNKEFVLLFLSAISAYVITYHMVLLFRMVRAYKALLLMIVAFLIHFILGRKSDKLLISIAKACVTSVGVIIIIDTWGLISLFSAMHGESGKITSSLGFFIGLALMIVSFIIVFFINYYSEWINKKICELKEQRGDSNR